MISITFHMLNDKKRKLIEFFSKGILLLAVKGLREMRCAKVR